MNLKQKGYCFGVVVISTITTITLHPGVCEPVGYLTGPSQQGHNNGIKSVLTSENFATRHTEKRQHLGMRQAERLRNYLKFPNIKEARETLGGTPKPTAKPKMESSLYQYQRSPSIISLNKDCKKGEVRHIVHGKFYFAGKSQTSSTDIQAGVRGELHPVVECGDVSMSLSVRRRWAVQLRVGPVNGSSFALSQLPPQCGYFIHKSWKELVIVAEYKGCHVTQEDDYYVLPLLWRKAPVKMSCPVTPVKPQALDALSQCCSPLGITVSIRGPSVAKELNVNVRGEWTPLLELVQHCGYSLDRRNAEIVITAPFLACGITSKDGKYKISLQTGEETFMLTCPISPNEDSQQSNQDYHSTITSKPMPETLKPFPWAPPFYLAPPHYPFPMYYHKTHLGDTADPLLPATTTFHSPLVTSLQPHEQNDHVRQPEDIYSIQASSGVSSHILPDLKHTIASSVSHSPTPALDSNPILQPRNYAFYYHYYHHPKIPLTNRPPKAPDPRPVVQVKSSTFHTSEMADFPPLFDLNSATELYHKPPESYVPPYYASYIAAKTNLGDSQNPKYSTHTSPFHTPVSEIHKEYKGNPYMNPHETSVIERDAQRMNAYMRPEIINRREFAPLTPAFKPLHPPADQHFVYSSSMIHNTPPYVYYYLPYDYYQIYHGPQSLQGENNPTPTYFPTRHTANPIPPSTDMEAGLGNPDYKPEVPVHLQPAHAEAFNHERESTTYSDLSYDDSSWEEWFNHAAEVDYIPEIYYIFPLFYDTDEYLYEEAVDEMQDHISAASMDPPFASPCGPGTVSYFHCTVSPGCSTFHAKDCISGEYFVFSLPKFVIEPKVAIPAHHSDIEVSCALKRLTSNPYLYFVPLNGCGVRKQMVDPMMVYQLQLETSNSDNSLIRMMVECSSYPGFLGAVTLYILDPLPLSYPAPVPVQLRIATDESFSSFHPEAHLPLSSLQGRLVYLELSLLQPPDPIVVLLVHYCMAYTLTPYISTTLIYDSCPSLSDSQLLPSSQYIMVTSFLSQTSLTPSSISDVDPEVPALKSLM